MDPKREATNRLSLLQRAGALAALLSLAGVAGVQAAPSRSPQAAMPVRLAPDLYLRSFQVGVFQPNPGRHGYTWDFQPRRAVKFANQRRFGWRICLQTTRSTVEWSEVFSLPSAPRQWGVTAATKISADRRSATTTRKVSLDENGCFENIWIMVPGDPRGRHTFRLSVEGHSVGELSFDVR